MSLQNFKLKIGDEIKSLAPGYSVSIIIAEITNTESDEKLWLLIDNEIKSFENRVKIEDINKLPGIYEMRQLYKNTGKDPNRYRPSSEALCRRIVHKKGLYKINTLVDIINYVSIVSGFSIGGFDYDKVVGNVTLGIGRERENFEAIGRGLLNIDGLPVYRDEAGCIGTPTSDEERTKLSMDTRNVLIIIHSPAGNERLVSVTDSIIQLMEAYLAATDINSSIYP